MRIREVVKHIYKELNDTYYILPSSVHELILVLFEKALDVEELKEMVVSINETEVGEEDRLSDSVYYYNGENVRVVA